MTSPTPLVTAQQLIRNCDYQEALEVLDTFLQTMTDSNHLNRILGLIERGKCLSALGHIEEATSTAKTALA
ncbi:MAG: hypothetical protein ACFFB3_14940 [Candidatus Hodarchaeota archaeon]